MLRLSRLLACLLHLLPAAVRGLGATPPMGFSHWAIETCNATMPSAAFFRATAEAFVALGLRDAGYRYLQVCARSCVL